jgi:hypothetical protein
MGRGLRTLFAALLLGLPPTSLAAQDGDARRAWWSLWSVPSRHDRVMVFMTTIHASHLDEGWSNDQALGVAWRGLYGGTFRTTHGPRGWSLGIERAWVERAAGPFETSLGFRGGLVYGYDRRLGWLAEEYPVLPFIQPLGSVAVGPVALDVAWAWVVFSLSAAVRF